MSVNSKKRSATDHGSDLVHALQKLDNLGLVCRLHAREQPGPGTGSSLLRGRKLVKFTSRVAHASSVLVLAKDANPAADGFSSSLERQKSQRFNTKSSFCSLLVSFRICDSERKKGTIFDFYLFKNCNRRGRHKPSFVNRKTNERMKSQAFIFRSLKFVIRRG